MKVPRGSSASLASIDEDLELQDDATITCTGEGSTLTVNGDIECSGDARFVGSVKCNNFKASQGSIMISGSLQCGDLEIEHDSDLEVSGDIRASDVEVDRTLKVGGTIEARDIEVGGRFDTTTVKATSVSVGGVFDARGDVLVEEIEVGGKLEIGGKIESRKLSVGGKATLVGGGKVADEIEVGGFLEVDGPLEYGTIDVGGTAKLRANARGQDIDVGGTLEVDGDLEFNELDVGGHVEVKGSAIGRSIDLGGLLSIGNRLELSGPLEIGGAIDIGGDAKAEDVEIGGEFKASSLKVRRIELSGGARTERGIFASEDVRVEHRSRVQGWIRAMREIVVESKSEVESISAERIFLEDRSRARNVYGEEIELGDRVEIAGELLYTHSITMGEGVRFSRQPEKVEVIPVEKAWTTMPPSSEKY
jgi:cytoskeletal protein CcmA (bactofilin family)